MSPREVLDTLPRNAQDMTSAQREAVVAFYAALSLAELRKRQALNSQQIEMAYAQRLTDTLIHLQTLDELLAEGVRVGHLHKRRTR